MLNFLIFILGASFASFLSVYVERGSENKFFSIKNKSICKNCLRKLNFFELVPILSFLLLRGKCRKCKTKIPTKLFLGEIFLGLWFLFAFINFAFSFAFFLTCLLGCILFLLSLQDLENMEVSSNLVYLALVIAILQAIFNFINIQDFNNIIFPILIFSPFWIIYFVNKNAIGEADPYVYTALGLFFGTQFSLSLFLYSVWLGSLYGIFYLVFINKKMERGVRIPFLPIIFTSALLILIFNYHFIKISDILLINEIVFK